MYRNREDNCSLKDLMREKYFFYGTKVILEFQLFNKLFCRISIKKKCFNVVKQGNHSTVEKIIIFSGKI